MSDSIKKMLKILILVEGTFDLWALQSLEIKVQSPWKSARPKMVHVDWHGSLKQKWYEKRKTNIVQTFELIFIFLLPSQIITPVKTVKNGKNWWEDDSWKNVNFLCGKFKVFHPMRDSIGRKPRRNYGSGGNELSTFNSSK